MTQSSGSDVILVVARQGVRRKARRYPVLDEVIQGHLMKLPDFGEPPAHTTGRAQGSDALPSNIHSTSAAAVERFLVLWGTYCTAFDLHFRPKPRSDRGWAPAKVRVAVRIPSSALEMSWSEL